MWTNWEPRMDMESQKWRNRGAAPKHLRMESAWPHTHRSDNNRKETDLWPRLNLPQVCVGGLNNLTYSLVSSRHWNLSRRILFTENLRSFGGIGRKKKVPAWKIHTEPVYFQWSKLKVSPDKTEWFSSIVDEIPPRPHHRDSYKKRGFAKKQKKKLHLHKRRHTFFPAVLGDVSNGSLTDQIFVSFSFSIWSHAHKKKPFFANLHRGGGSGAERGLGGNSFGFVDARETSFLAQSDKKGRPSPEQTMFQINRRLIFTATAWASLTAEPQRVINQHPSNGSRWGRWRWRSAVHSTTFYFLFFITEDILTRQRGGGRGGGTLINQN